MPHMFCKTLRASVAHAVHLRRAELAIAHAVRPSHAELPPTRRRGARRFAKTPCAVADLQFRISIKAATPQATVALASHLAAERRLSNFRLAVARIAMRQPRAILDMELAGLSATFFRLLPSTSPSRSSRPSLSRKAVKKS
uniref:Uncharacterized protein n=1 Tax=Arundo donax TaxID=35708 RepID=A0A0A9HJG5_ARUDO